MTSISGHYTAFTGSPFALGGTPVDIDKIAISKVYALPALHDPRHPADLYRIDHRKMSVPENPGCFINRPDYGHKPLVLGLTGKISEKQLLQPHLARVRKLTMSSPQTL